MGHRLSPWTWAYLASVALSMMGVGLGWYLGVDPGPVVPRFMAITTLVLGAVAVGRTVAPSGWAGVLLVGGTISLGAVSEIVGVYTGWPFGAYEYTANWFPTVALPGGERYPVLLPLAWFLMSASSFAVASRLAKGLASVPLAALIAALADTIVMEPVMAGPLAYWQWTPRGPLPGGAPVCNLVGWFIVTALAAAWIRRCRRDEQVAGVEPAIVLAAFLALTSWIGISGFSGSAG